VLLIAIRLVRARPASPHPCDHDGLLRQSPSIFGYPRGQTRMPDQPRARQRAAQAQLRETRPSTAAALCCCWRWWPIASRSWMSMIPGAARCWSSLTRPSAACNGCCPLTAGGASHGATTARCWAASCGSCTPAGRGVMSPAGSGPGRPAMAGCGAGSGMGPGRGCGRCWPLAASWAQATVEVASSARRCWRRRQWQRRARA
jgi:hypothetical protein